MKKISKNSLSAAIPAVIFTAGYFLLTQFCGTSICLIRSTTGFPCPGCGLTSAGIAVIRGNFAAAWNFNAVIYLLPPALAVLLLNKRFIRPKFPRFARYFYLGCAVIMVIYFVIRMCLYFPHGDYPMNISPDTILRKLTLFLL